MTCNVRQVSIRQGRAQASSLSDKTKTLCNRASPFFPVKPDSVTRRMTQANHSFTLTFVNHCRTANKTKWVPKPLARFFTTSNVDIEIARRHWPGTRRNFTKPSYHYLPAIPRQRDSSTDPPHFGGIYGHYHRNRSNPSM